MFGSSSPPRKQDNDFLDWIASPFYTQPPPPPPPQGPFHVLDSVYGSLLSTEQPSWNGSYKKDMLDTIFEPVSPGDPPIVKKRPQGLEGILDSFFEPIYSMANSACSCGRV